MLKVKEFDAVLLKDGRRADITDVLSEDTFCADIGSSEDDWESIIVKLEDIQEIIQE